MKRQFNISADFTNRPTHSYNRRQYSTGPTYYTRNIISIYKERNKRKSNDYNNE